MTYVNGLKQSTVVGLCSNIGFALQTIEFSLWNFLLIKCTLLGKLDCWFAKNGCATRGSVATKTASRSDFHTRYSFIDTVENGAVWPGILNLKAVVKVRGAQPPAPI